jgi:hypothetical protein
MPMPPMREIVRRASGIGVGRATKNGVATMKPSKVLLVLAAMALALGHVAGCASIAGYQASHPYYKFPGGGGGGGGNGG